MTTHIKGVLTAIVTPFDPSGDVCIQRLRAQVQRQMKFDNGIFCNGTNGEFFVLSRSEKLLVTETCVNEVNGKVPVVAHIGEISTATTIKLGKAVAAMGAGEGAPPWSSRVAICQTAVMPTASMPRLITRLAWARIREGHAIAATARA